MDGRKSCSVSGHPLSVEGEYIYRFLGSDERLGFL